MNAVIFAAKLATVACVAAVVGKDGRSDKESATNVYTIRNNVWEGTRMQAYSMVQANSICIGVEACISDSWYKRNLRVSRRTFNEIVKRLEEFAFDQAHHVPAKNSYVEMRMRVAMT